jgi:hypothetical protein
MALAEMRFEAARSRWDNCGMRWIRKFRDWTAENGESSGGQAEEAKVAAPTSSVYSYTAEQAQVVRLYDLYRNCLTKSKYYGHKLIFFKRLALTMDILIALAASSAFTGQAIMKTSIGLNVASFLLLISAVIAVIRPILKIGESIDLYSKLYYAYTELFYRIESLNDDIRRENALTKVHQKKASDIFDRYRDLELQNDPAENVKKMGEFQDAVDRAVPASTLWLPPSVDDDEQSAPAASPATTTAPTQEGRAAS